MSRPAPLETNQTHQEESMTPTTSMGGGSALSFESPSLAEELYATSDEQIVAAPFGIIAFATSDERVQVYSDAESKLSGLPASTVIGKMLFDEVAPCMNNFMVAQRFRSGEALDEVIDYVFTLRMSPTPVRLRLIRQLGQDRMFLCVQWLE
jgi:photoactive yellow protein